MSPTKSLNLLINEVIENQIDQWIEDKQEPEQIDLFEEEI